MKTSNKRLPSGLVQTHGSAARLAGSAFAYASALSPRPIAAAVMLSLAVSGMAHAQQADPAVKQEPLKTDVAQTEAAKLEAAKAKAAAKAANTIDTIVVTGIRRGIESAIATKRDSDSIVESISAEDIGKLPDVSIAESIARLPGLAAQRVAGRAQVISVRGLSPDFATTLLNGREQVSTGDNRSVEFDQYPSELINSVTVYKTPDAGLVGQGLSGTLDLQTVRPLSYGKQTVALNLRDERNSLSGLGADGKTTGNRFSATYIDQFAEKTVGVAFGYAHLESPILAQEFGTYSWSTDGRSGLAPGTISQSGQKFYARTGKNTRDGFIGIVEWKPSQNWTSVFDGYYSKFKRTETARGLETNFGDYNGGNTPGLNYTSPVLDGNILVGGTATGLYPLVRGIYNSREDKLSALGWNNKYKLDAWTFTGDLSYSKAEREEQILETNAQYRSATGTAVLDTGTFALPSGRFPTASYGLNYSDAARIQIGPSIYGAGYGKVPHVKDELTSFKLQGNYALDGFFRDVDFGFNYGDREKNKRQPEASLNATAFQPLAAEFLNSPTNLNFAGLGSVVSWNVLNVLGSYYNPFKPSDNEFGYLIQKTWKVREKISTSYVKLNLDSEFGAVTLRGNVGFQVQNTDQSSTANFFDNAAIGNKVKVNTDGKTYTDVLPSMNLVFGFSNQQTLRLAIAKQIARPRLDQLKSAFEFDISRTEGVPSGSGGNPKLEPWRATAYDISYEKYFAAKGYIALAGFYKDLKTYIFDQTAIYDFSRFTVGNPLATTNIGKFNQPLNGKGGTLSGLELTVSVPLNMLTDALDGFGVVASGSKNSSKIKVDNSNLGNAITLPGLSKDVSNLTAYYEKYGFSTRISQRKRSDFIGEITGFGADRELRYVKGEKIIDFQVGYEFSEGSLKGLGLLLQVNNLTNSAYQTYSVTPNRPVEFQKYGRTVLFGVNYKL